MTTHVKEWSRLRCGPRSEKRDFFGVKTGATDFQRKILLQICIFSLAISANERSKIDPGLFWRDFYRVTYIRGTYLVFALTQRAISDFGTIERDSVAENSKQRVNSIGILLASLVLWVLVAL